MQKPENAVGTGSLASAKTANHGTARIATHVESTEALELNASETRLLTVGSQLVHGSVGLNAAERVYADAGISALRVPTILLSVMPHYESVHHVDIGAPWITDTLADLTVSGALNALETVSAGYFARVDQIEALAAWLAVKQQNERPTFVLDPTLGDIDVGFYTDPALAPAFREHLVPLATGITPNLFELAHLTGVSLDVLGTLDSIEQAARSLVGPNTEWIIVTGIELAPTESENSAVPHIGEMVVTRDVTQTHRHERIDTLAKGLGDTFTAALIVSLLAGEPITHAVDRAAADVRHRVR